MVDRTDDSDWDEEDLLPLMPPGKTFKEYVMYDDNVATEKPLDDNWENELMLNVRNQNELDVENLQEHSGDSECDSNATKYTSTQSWNYSCYMMDFALSTKNTELLETMTKAQDLLKKPKKLLTEK